jgi:aminoglycoside phosphotransferase (APT) family kinase protein
LPGTAWLWKIPAMPDAAAAEQSVPGIAGERVTRFFREHVPGAGGDLQFGLISGGRSNLTYLVRGKAGEWVLRRPPLGHVLPTAHDMAREYRVLAALSGTDVPVPRPLALCEDPAVNGAPFYVMEYRPGVVLAQEIPAGYAAGAADCRRISDALVETLVRLHAVDYHAVGLDGFGHPNGYLERQVRRWSQQWERSRTAELPAIDELARRLRRALPPSPAPTVVHGDYRLGNMALDPHDPGRVVAVFDWEMATLGDPLADLGYTLIYWTDPGDPPPPAGAGTASPFTTRPGFLTRAEIVAEYARRSGRSTDAVEFYQVLALYKLAIISEGIYARYLQGKTVGAEFAGMTRAAVGLAERALAIAASAADGRLRA